jgi:hypothetical protein
VCACVLGARENRKWKEKNPPKERRNSLNSKNQRDEKNHNKKKVYKRATHNNFTHSQGVHFTHGKTKQKRSNAPSRVEQKKRGEAVQINQVLAQQQGQKKKREKSSSESRRGIT